MIKDYFKLAIENITHRKLRSFLTIVGIVIGIAAVVALISLGQGVKKVVYDEFQKLGTDKIFVTSAVGFSGSSGLAPLTEKDITVIKRVSGVQEAVGVKFASGKIESHNEQIIETVIGVPSGEQYSLVEESYNFKYLYGRPLKQGDKYKVMVGNSLYSGKRFSKPINVGDKIIINGQRFDVVAILEKMGDPDVDNGVVILSDIYEELYNTKNENYILVRVKSGEDPLVVAENIKKDLRNYRNVKEGEEDFNVQTTDELLNSFGIILNALTAIVVGIAAISLFVGGVGIMNTMYTAVLQRTSEIGIMKAVGAKNDQILKIFLIESGVIGLIGGIIGVIIGIGLSKLIEFVGRIALDTVLLKAYFPWYLIIGSLAFAFVVGTISGLLPAIQAAKQNPVDALRYE
ncbi:MAG: ABC transporter permease [Candidatus Woesearchaeota archaeon]|nr:MAG: ABC transporter permease [Candidatus Woesearchaeota archaeon]